MWLAHWMVNGSKPINGEGRVVEVGRELSAMVADLRLPRVTCGRHRLHRDPIRVQMPPARQVDVRPVHGDVDAMLPVVPAPADRHVLTLQHPKMSKVKVVARQRPEEEPASWLCLS